MGRLLSRGFLVKNEIKNIPKKETIVICAECFAEDSMRNSGDTHWCDECKTIEGKTLELEEYGKNWIDEDNNIYNDENTIIGKVTNE